MKITYKEIVNANEPLLTLAKEKLSVKEAVGLARMLKPLMEEFSIYQEKEREIIEKFGEINDDGRYFIKNENIISFNTEYGELLDYEINLDIEPVTIKSDIQIEANSIIAIEKFVCFE